MDEVLVRFRLVGDEARALRELAEQEWREPRDQVRFVLRNELKRRGLLTTHAEPELTTEVGRDEDAR